MKRLTILYDGGCVLCLRCRLWALRQARYFQIEFIDQCSLEARTRFPTLNLGPTPSELIAIGDDGSIYRDDSAWIMCLYAMRRYRPLAMRLAKPALRGLARRVYDLVSSHRYDISRLLPSLSDASLKQFVDRAQAPEVCEFPGAGPNNVI